MTQPTSGTTIDVRTLPPRERHPLILRALEGLDDAQTLDLVNDHDPRPLYYQLQAERPGIFSWVYLQGGPDIWQVRITRQARPRTDSGCCGACGGA